MSNLEIIIQKNARTLFLRRNARVESAYAVALGRNRAADKTIEGDEATPLGEFYICARNPRSKYFLSICISYPNAEDAARGLATGLITPEQQVEILAAIRERRTPPQRTRLGGEIYIHGQGSAQAYGRPKDWTRGCIAVENTAMREIYERVSIGTPVLITP